MRVLSGRCLRRGRVADSGVAGMPFMLSWILATSQRKRPLCCTEVTCTAAKIQRRPSGTQIVLLPRVPALKRWASQRCASGAGIFHGGMDVNAGCIRPVRLRRAEDAPLPPVTLQTPRIVLDAATTLSAGGVDF